MSPIRTLSCLSCCSAFRRFLRIFFSSWIAGTEAWLELHMMALRNEILTFFVSFNGFSATAFLSQGAGMGIGCWTYSVMGESVVRILRLSMPLARSS